MELLLDPRTVNSRKVLAGLKLIGADYTIKKFDYFQAEQKSPEFVAINPKPAIWATAKSIKIIPLFKTSIPRGTWVKTIIEQINNAGPIT